MRKDIDLLLGVTQIGGGKHDRNNLTRDFFEMLAIRISNAFDPVHLEKRRSRIAEIIGKYTNAELLEFERCTSLLIDILQYNLKMRNLEDTLGRLFERHHRLIAGQELTPQGVADILARIAITPGEQMRDKGYLTLSDSTCGSGGSFLASVQRFMELGYNPVTDMVVLANDINARAVHMAYIQTSFYGIPAVITQADVFTLNEAARWYTPAYILGNWVWCNPMNHIAGRNREDERLKMMTDPMYAAIRRLWGWPKEDSKQ
jgi:hypothetical protein